MDGTSAAGGSQLRRDGWGAVAGRLVARLGPISKEPTRYQHEQRESHGEEPGDPVYIVRWGNLRFSDGLSCAQPLTRIRACIAPTSTIGATTMRENMSGSRSFNHSTTMVIAIFLFVTAMVGAVPTTIWAASRTQTIINQSNCQSECTISLRSCTAGCCGTTTCGKTCVGVCDATYNVCLNICGFAAIDGAFFDTATIAPNGRRIRVGGPLSCPEGATADLSFSLSQSDGAIATGQANVECGGDTTYTADVHTQGSNSFEPFAATQACGVARIHAANLSLNALQWCRDITVVPEGVELLE